MTSNEQSENFFESILEDLTQPPENTTTDEEVLPVNAYWKTFFGGISHFNSKVLQCGTEYIIMEKHQSQ